MSKIGAQPSTLCYMMNRIMIKVYQNPIRVNDRRLPQLGVFFDIDCFEALVRSVMVVYFQYNSYLISLVDHIKSHQLLVGFMMQVYYSVFIVVYGLFYGFCLSFRFFFALAMPVYLELLIFMSSAIFCLFIYTMQNNMQCFWCKAFTWCILILQSTWKSF